MSRSPVLDRRGARRLAVLLGGVLVTAALGAVGCANDHETVRAETNAPIGVETSQFAVTLENKAGGPLLNLDVAVIAPGTPPFTHLVSRLEAGDKVDVSLSDFSSRDGTALNLRWAKPRSVKITATDLTDKKYEVEAPWR